MRNPKILRLCELALLVAVEIVMGLTPLGYLNLGIIAASLLTIPVAIGAILLGPLESTLLGLIFGVISFAKGFTSTGLMTRAMYAASIPGSFVVTVGARVLMGLTVGLLVAWVRKKTPKDLLSSLVGGFGAPLLNTCFYMGLLMLLFYHSEYVQNLVSTTGISNPILLIGFMVGTQALIEAVTCGILSIAVSKALQAALRKKNK